MTYLRLHPSVDLCINALVRVETRLSSHVLATQFQYDQLRSHYEARIKLICADAIYDDYYWREYKRRVDAGDPNAHITAPIYRANRRWVSGCETVGGYNQPGYNQFGGPTQGGAVAHKRSALGVFFF